VATQETQTPRVSIDPATSVGIVALTVADLDRSVAYYTDAIGLTVLERVGPEAILGVAVTPLLALREHRDALPWLTDRMTGLYHFAILAPTRQDLGRWLEHYLSTSNPPPGQGDHYVSEAFYLRDPDGHGIEVYADRPREGWHWSNGLVHMGTDPVDVRGLLTEARKVHAAWTGLPPGTTMGHVHLQVGDIAPADAFYHRVLGFDVTAHMPSALFVSAGGYHHHLGLNTWHSRGAGPAPADTASLRFFTLALPTDEALAAVRDRLVAANIGFGERDGMVVVADPWQNQIILHVGRVDPDRARELSRNF